MRLSLCTLAAICIVASALGCGKEHGMYEGSQISATIWLLAFYAFSFVCLVGSLLKRWGTGPLLAGLFVLVCCTVMLCMTSYLWVGVVLLIMGVVIALLGFRRLRKGPASSG